MEPTERTDPQCISRASHAKSMSPSTDGGSVNEASVLCNGADRQDGSGVFGVRRRTFLKPGPRVDKLKRDLCVFVLGFVWMPETQTMMSSPPLVELRSSCFGRVAGRVALNTFIFFDLYYLCSFKYSPLVHLITSCTVKSISAQFKRFIFYLLLDWMFVLGLSSDNFFFPRKYFKII